MLTQLKSFLAHPRARDLNIDAPETSVRRADIIQTKPFLRQLYKQWYDWIINALPMNSHRLVLELGAGGGFLKHIIPDLIASEILYIPHADIVLDAQSLPFSHASLRAIVMIDVLHHIPNVALLFKEAAYCVEPGGIIVMIEPWVTQWSRVIYKYLHHEPFHPEAQEWSFPKGGPLSQANSALPWIIFERDRKRFEAEYADWRIHEIKLHTPFCYLLSGGVSFKSFMPGCMFSVWQKIERQLSTRMNYWAMFAMIVLQRAGKDDNKS